MTMTVCVMCAYLGVCVHTLVGLPLHQGEVKDASAQVVQ